VTDRPHGTAYAPPATARDARTTVAGLLPMAVQTAGLSLVAGGLGAGVGVLLSLLWLRVRVELVVAVSALAFVGVGGGLDATLAFVLVGLGCLGLLAVDLTTAWNSPRPLVAFAALAGPLCAVAVAYAPTDARYWLAAGVLAVVGLGSYGLHRYQLLGLGLLDEAPRPEASTGDPTNAAASDDPTNATSTTDGGPSQ